MAAMTIPLRSIPTLAVSIAALAFVAWISAQTPRSNSLYADPSPARERAVASDVGQQAAATPQSAPAARG